MTTEIRYAGSTEIDEIVSANGGVHFEMLGDEAAMLWVGDDCHVNICIVDGKLVVVEQNIDGCKIVGKKGIQ